MKLTWYRDTNWRRLRRFSLWGVVAIVVGISIQLGSFWISSGINPFRLLYYDYLEKHYNWEPLVRALHQPGITQIENLLQKQPNLIYARFDGGNTPLYESIGRADSTNLLVLFSKNGTDINAGNLYNETALHNSVIVHDPAAEVFLLSHGADWTIKDHDGFTALDRAVKHSYKDVVEPLLAKGANVNLYDAILLDDRDTVLKLLSADPSLVNRRCLSGTMLISLAAGNGLKDMVELLIQHGAEINPKDDPPLCPASESGQYDVAQLLIEHGADVNARNSDGRSPLWLAAGRMKTMKLLLSKGADVNAAAGRGETALSIIATQRYPRAVASWNRTKSTNNYPPPPIRSFEQVRPKPANREMSKQTPEAVKLLLEYHANPNLTNNLGETVLHGVISGEMAELLINAGADVNARDNKGRTPLTVALQMKRTEVAAMLRKHGATE